MESIHIIETILESIITVLHKLNNGKIIFMSINEERVALKRHESSYILIDYHGKQKDDYGFDDLLLYDTMNDLKYMNNFSRITKIYIMNDTNEIITFINL